MATKSFSSHQRKIVQGLIGGTNENEVDWEELWLDFDRLVFSSWDFFSSAEDAHVSGKTYGKAMSDIKKRLTQIEYDLKKWRGFSPHAYILTNAELRAGFLPGELNNLVKKMIGGLENLKESNAISKSKGVRKDNRPDSVMYETLVGRLANIWVRHTGMMPEPNEAFRRYVNQILVFLDLKRC